ncbi:epididymal sperm-binding protein 1-like [Pantherophis guttatus]|uniref:Epididymal sperm-binding protein 1-like n=1 Tax=Pantherophis guttatus TaxID=94885 RepID=A0ABM3ZMI6_PANGU|nr:epididymal sperm-binding protein 1-like [Pantherophis guttatus]
MASITAFLLFCTLFQLLIATDTRPCVFPFIYNGKLYHSCTNDHSWRGLWCATTANYDTSPQWKHCSYNEYGGNSHGQSCVFPFKYKGYIFYSCINEDNKKGNFWCATTRNYDKDKQWSYCADTNTRPCVFPFIYNGKLYHSCTNDHSWRGLWCATTANYDTSPQWKHCSYKEYGGNSHGQSCVFPFKYKGYIFYSCINEDNKKGNFWCATTRNYDKDKQWSYCADTIK